MIAQSVGQTGSTVGPVVDEVNRRTYASTVDYYRSLSDLQPAEEAILARVATETRDQPILDLGVGCGRTTPHLRRLSSDYVGVDYTAELVEGAQRRYPGVRFLLADARDLRMFDDDSFQLAFFSFNGLDSVNHAGRLQILDEVYRVLRPGGMFVFSAHNQDSPDHTSGFQLGEFDPDTSNPLRLAVRSGRFAQKLLVRSFNYARRRHLDARQSAYSIINDTAHDYGLMVYYITVANQRRQLVDAGFLPHAQAFDGDTGAPICGVTHASCVHYIARK